MSRSILLAVTPRVFLLGLLAFRLASSSSLSKPLTILLRSASMMSCATCGLPLVLEVESDDDDQMDPASGGSASMAQAHTVPDDVQMSCGCHFHWQCLLDAYEIMKCPSCNADISSASPSGTAQILCTLHNEGGLQPDLDILPLLTEEVYLKAYPEERRARAFLEFCKQGDVPAIMDLLRCSNSDSDSESGQEDEGGTLSPAEIVLYQDPIDNHYSGLHSAVINAQAEVIWLLLLFASPGGAQRLPREVFSHADALGALAVSPRAEHTDGHSVTKRCKWIDCSGTCGYECLARRVGSPRSVSVTDSDGQPSLVAVIEAVEMSCTWTSVFVTYSAF